MPNFDPAQELPDDATVQTVPLSLPNQFGAVVAGAPSNPDISPRGVPGDVVINPSAIVDPQLRAAYVAAHQAQLPAPGVPTPIDQVPVAAPPPTAPSVTGPVLPAVPGQKGIGGGGGGALPPGSADLQKQITEGNSDEAKALQHLGDAQEIAGEQTGQAYDDRAELRRQQAADLAAEQVYVRQRQQALDAEDAQNLKVAREKTIPDFWAGREGSLVGAAITVGLSGAAGALLGTTQNTALTAIQHNVDSYYTREKDKIDNLYKYAEAKGRLDDNMRAQYAGELTDLLQQHAYTLAAAADRIEQVQKEGGASVDQAQTAYMASQLKAKSAQEIQGARGIDVNIYDAKTKRIGANAEAAKVGLEKQRLAQATGDKEEDKQIQLAQSTSGKKAEIARNRVDGNADIVEALKNPNISGGELRQKLEQAMALNQGEGKRGVSTASLHFVAPALVSAEGQLSDKFDQLISGKSGQELRQKIGQLAQTGLGDAQREYAQQSKDFVEGRKGIGYYAKNPAKLEEHRKIFYPDRAAPAAAAAPDMVTIKNGKTGETKQVTRDEAKRLGAI